MFDSILFTIILTVASFLCGLIMFSRQNEKINKAVITASLVFGAIGLTIGLLCCLIEIGL